MSTDPAWSLADERRPRIEPRGRTQTPRGASRTNTDPAWSLADEHRPAMSIERARACSGPSPVTKRLCATIVFFIGVICVFGGYLLCRMSRNDVKRSNDIVSYNLTVAAENLYKKAKRIAPKAVHHSDPEKVTARLLDIFNCTQAECGTISNYNVAEFIKRSVNLKVIRLLKSVNNATMYLDSLR